MITKRHLKDLGEYLLWFSGFIVIGLALLINLSVLERILAIILGIILLIMGWA